MRNPLKRQPSTEPKLSLRERLAATKAKYSRTLAVHRALNAPLPERPTPPGIEPPIDAVLLDALDDLERLDAAQAVMSTAGRGGERDADTVPGYEGLEQARDGALDRLAETRAESLIGLQAKAKALLTRSVLDMGGRQSEDIAESLARDLLGASNRTIEPRPDPIIAAIEECRRLAAELAVIHDVCGSRPDNDPSWAEFQPAYDASWAQWRDVVLKTVPRTAESCRALAAYARDWFAHQQVREDEDGPAVLDLIARSPLL